MYWCHDVCIYWDLDVGVFGTLRCSWDVWNVRVALSVVSAVSKLLFGRCWSPLCSLTCIAFVFSMYMSVCPSGAFCFSRIGVQSDTPSSYRGAKCYSILFE
jgi:hypothetical protein